MDTFTHNNRRYDLSKLRSLLSDRPERYFKISDLRWVLAYCVPVESRVSSARLQVPIFVTRSGGRLVPVDGLHRVAKANGLGITRLPGKLVTAADLKSVAI